MRRLKVVRMSKTIIDSRSMSGGIVLDLTKREFLRVLHVDDDPVFLRVAKQCLEIEGRLQVDTALSVEKAKEKMKREMYDAVVSDYVMPGEDGLSFLKELRDAGNTIPFVMFTGKGREEIAIKALNLGADGYFSKIGSPETVYGELAHGICQIVESKRAEETLAASENYLKTMLNSISTGLIVIDEETHEIVDANAYALEMIGASKQDAIGKVCHSFICPAEKGKCPISDLKQTVDKSERLLLKADGSTLQILKTVTAATWRGHKYLVESFVDITERKKAERSLLESQEKSRRLFLDNPEASIYMDSSFHIMDINPRFTTLFGYSLGEIKGKHIDDVVVPKDKTKEGETLDKKALKGYVCYDTVRKRKDGTLVPVSISAAPIMIEGRPIGYVGVYKDIVEMKRYEESLSALNIYSRDLNTAKSMEEIYELTLDVAEKALGFEFADILMTDAKMLRLVVQRGHFENLSLELPLDGDKGITVRVARTGKSALVPDISKDNAYVDVGLQTRSELAVPIKIGHKVLGVLNAERRKMDAFDEKDQELLEILASHAATAMSNLEYARNLEAYAREIRESQQKFERLFMDNPEAAVHLDSSFHILNVNPRFMRLFGCSSDEIKGKHINDVIVPKDKMEEAVVFDIRASKGKTYHEDTVRKRKDGSLVPVAFSAAPIIVENQVVGYIAVYKDISQLKKAQDELREMLQKLEKMNEKLRVVGGLTRHDARNKLGAITGNVYLAKKKLAGDDEVLNNLKEMEVAVEQIVKIFDFAKTYEMLGVEELRHVDVGKMINEAVALFSGLNGIKLNNNCCGLTVLADSLLRQLFYNLVDNSLKYGEKIKTISIYYEKTGEDKLKLVYEDDGVGIAEAEKKKLFQEGYGRGTGFGLYLIRKMCEGYGWNIQETGKKGEGAKFTITIPRIGEKGETNYNIS